jgi:hypothetical protein
VRGDAGHYMVSDIDALYLGAHLEDYACDLVSENHR